MRKKIIAAAVALVAISGPLYAQTEAAAPVGIDEIIVTAQKREQNLRNVPIAISALSPAYPEKREITSIA